jgi:hypothetical protein
MRPRRPRSSLSYLPILGWFNSLPASCPILVLSASVSCLRHLAAPRIIALMKRTLSAIAGLILCPVLAAPALAADAATPPVPAAPDWSAALLLVLLWVLLAAAVLGPVVRYFRIEPHSTQTFSDDPPARH